MLDEGQHQACVDRWLERTARDLSPALLWRLFGAAFGALRARTRTTLGEVTLTAIADRVLHNASEKFPFLSSALDVAVNGGNQPPELDERIRSVDRVEVEAGIRFVLTELMTVLGNLTAEILTPQLHEALASVSLPEAAPISEAGHSKNDTNEGERP